MTNWNPAIDALATLLIALAVAVPGYLALLQGRKNGRDNADSRAVIVAKADHITTLVNGSSAKLQADLAAANEEIRTTKEEIRAARELIIALNKRIVEQHAP